MYDWLVEKGMKFRYGPDRETDLTEEQVLDQCKMYIAALRIADEFGCDAVGIQYQQGLKDLAPASDLAEGLAQQRGSAAGLGPPGRLLFPGQALPHFNEVDEGVGLDALVTNRVWNGAGTAAGDHASRSYAMARTMAGRPLQMSGRSRSLARCRPRISRVATRRAVSERQPPMYFRLGGGTIKGISKPGHVVWSRVYVEAGRVESGYGPGARNRAAAARKPNGAGGSPRRNGR